MPENEKNLRDEIAKVISDMLYNAKVYQLNKNPLGWNVADVVIGKIAKHLHRDIFDGYVVHKGKE